MASTLTRPKKKKSSPITSKAVAVFIAQIFQSLESDLLSMKNCSATHPPINIDAQSKALCQCVLVYYQRFLSSNELFRAIRREVHGGRHAVGAARLLRQWILLRYDTDYRKRELLHKLIAFLSQWRGRSSRAAILPSIDGLVVLASELNAAKLALLRAARLSRNAPSPALSSARLALLAEEVGPTSSTLLANKTPQLRRFLSMPAPQAAALLTLVDYELFAAISLLEFYNQGWKDPQRSPRLSAFVARINRISQWVASSILVQSSLSVSSRVASDFIRIAYFCYQNGNYVSSLAIMQAFDLSYMSRLKKLWKISEEMRAMAKQIEMVGLHKDNYKAYRLELRKRRDATQCSIPMLAVHQKDLTMIEEGNSDYLPDGSVNIEKVILMGQTLCDLAFFQRTPPAARINHDANTDAHRHLLESLPCKTEVELERRSEELRPRTSQPVSIEESSSSWAGSSTDLRVLSPRTNTDESSSSTGSQDELMEV